jgi:hypothetical protein
VQHTVQVILTVTEKNFKKGKRQQKSLEDKLSRQMYAKSTLKAKMANEAKKKAQIDLT